MKKGVRNTPSRTAYYYYHPPLSPSLSAPSFLLLSLYASPFFPFSFLSPSPFTQTMVQTDLPWIRLVSLMETEEYGNALKSLDTGNKDRDD